MSETGAPQTKRESSLSTFWAPRWWPTWAVLLALRGVARLPYGWQMRLGSALGRVLERAMRRDRRIARRNLEICFPELDENARSRLLRRHFRSLGISIVEAGLAWYSPIERLRGLIEVRGGEHIEAAYARGRGILLVGAHFTPVEIGVTILEDLCERCACMYRPQRNPMITAMMRRGRRFARIQIPTDDVRQLIRRLAENYAVVYLPDQTYLGSQSALLPFFGEPAMTNTAVSRIAKISGAAVLTYFFRRKDDDTGYVVEIGPPLEQFPSADAESDTRRFVELLERYIRRVPDQYLWVYKRFKARPPPLPNVYA